MDIPEEPLTTDMPAPMTTDNSRTAVEVTLKEDEAVTHKSKSAKNLRLSTLVTHAAEQTIFTNNVLSKSKYETVVKLKCLQ